jgi:hypothetical protein
VLDVADDPPGSNGQVSVQVRPWSVGYRDAFRLWQGALGMSKDERKLTKLQDLKRLFDL